MTEPARLNDDWIQTCINRRMVYNDRTSTSTTTTGLKTANENLGWSTMTEPARQQQRLDSNY